MLVAGREGEDGEVEAGGEVVVEVVTTVTMETEGEAIHVNLFNIKLHNYMVNIKFIISIDLC